MTNSVDPDQTAPIGAVCYGSTLFASILNSSVILGNYLQQTTFSRQHFQMHFFLGALRVKTIRGSLTPKWQKLASLAQEICTLCFQFFGAGLASKGYPFKNTFNH